MSENVIRTIVACQVCKFRKSDSVSQNNRILSGGLSSGMQGFFLLVSEQLLSERFRYSRLASGWFALENTHSYRSSQHVPMGSSRFFLGCGTTVDDGDFDTKPQITQRLVSKIPIAYDIISFQHSLCFMVINYNLSFRCKIVMKQKNLGHAFSKHRNCFNVFFGVRDKNQKKKKMYTL